MITLLETALDRADGSYFTEEDLSALDQSVQFWSARRQTYDLLRLNETQIIEESLTALSNLIVDSVRFDAGTLNKCRRDMTVVFRACATAMLLQDEELLKDRFLYWMQNIMQALQKQQTNAIVYQTLQQSISKIIPSQHADLIMPYVQLVREWLS